MLVKKKIEVLKGRANDEVRKFVDETSDSLLYQSPKFVSFLAKHLSGRELWFILRSNDEIACVLPAIAKTSISGRTVYNSLPFFGSNGGVIHDKASKEQIVYLVSYFLQWAELEGAVSATIVSNPLDPEAIEALEQLQWDFKKERISQITNIDKISTPAELILAFEDPRPRNIRKALREGVTVYKSKSSDSIRFLAETHKTNLEALEGAFKSAVFFQQVFETFGDSEVELYIGSIGDDKVAALLVFFHKGIAEYFTPAVVAEFRKTQALSLLIYEAMISSLHTGITKWNWGGTWTTQKGVYDFKRKWGAVDRDYFVFTKVFDRSVLGSSKSALVLEWPDFYVVPFDELINP